MPEPPQQDDPDRSNAGARALAAVMGGLVGLAIDGPAGALAGAAAVPYLESVARNALNELRLDSQRRATQVLAEAANDANLGLDELERRILASDRTRLLTGTAIEAAMRTVNEAKIRTIGRALAAGLIAADEAAVDVEQLILGAVADMETPHFAVLDLLVNYSPDPRFGDFRINKYDPETELLNPSAGEFLPGSRQWTEGHIASARPSVGPVLPSLLGTLQRHGLITLADTLPEALGKFSREQRRRSANAVRGGGSAELTVGQISGFAPPATWVPTELGARLLTYAEEQAAEPDDHAGGTS